jgi:hypothetical protein
MISYKKLRVTIISRIIIERKTTKLQSHSIGPCSYIGQPNNCTSFASFRYITKWMKKVKRTYNLEWREYLLDYRRSSKSILNT